MCAQTRTISSLNRPMLLDEPTFIQTVRELARRDEDLSRVVQSYGRPPLWVREPGFPTLVYIILEQQVSLASARALFDRLQRAVKPLTPGRFLKLTEAEMRVLGFSRQKTLYTRLLADAIQKRQFVLHTLHEMPDDLVREK